MPLIRFAARICIALIVLCIQVLTPGCKGSPRLKENISDVRNYHRDHNSQSFAKVQPAALLQEKLERRPARQDVEGLNAFTKQAGERTGVNASMESRYEKAGVCRPTFPKYPCTDKKHCFLSQEMCDGHSHCDDFSDECAMMCTQTFVCPFSGKCLSLDRFCDGEVDCEDESDEVWANEETVDGFTAGNDSFVCANKWVLNTATMRGGIERESDDRVLRCHLPAQLVCDGINHCGDHSDECNDRCSSDKKFLCTNGKCIAAKHRCDGYDNCGDGSDECTECHSSVFLCNDGACIPQDRFCDGKIDCKDGSDEFYSFYNSSMLTEQTKEVLCDNIRNSEKRKCVLPEKYVCDGYEHCYYREDECTAQCPYSFTCDNGNCLVDSFVCNGVDDCGDMSDECNGQCDKVFACDDGRCLSIDRFCDGVVDCEDGTDEIARAPQEQVGFYCTNSQRLGSNACKLPDRFVCDGIDHCLDRTDECQDGCKSSYFCDDGATCIPRNKVCDGIAAQCSDQTDDVKSTTNFPAMRGFICKVNRDEESKTCVLPQVMVNDDVADCEDKSDLCAEINLESKTNDSSSLKESTCVKCISNSNFTISKRQVCDGVFDCPDLSDECLCHNVSATQVCRTTCFSLNGKQKCPFSCPMGQVPCVRSRTISEKLSNQGSKTKKAYFDPEESLESDARHENITKMECINISQFCDGVLDCSNKADEIDCGQDRECGDSAKHQQSSDNGKTKSMGLQGSSTMYNPGSCVPNHNCSRAQPDNKYTPLYAVACDGVPECYDLEDECSDRCAVHPDFCNFRNYEGVYICPEAGVLPGVKVCDGQRNCAESGQDEKDCPGRFYCASGDVVSIPEYKRCDYVSDCKDESDEMNCTKTHLYCEHCSPLYVPLRMKFDGKYDCHDESDECPSDFSKDSWFSSREKLIDSTFLNVMVWVMGILSAIGNTAVIVSTLCNVCGKNGRMTNVAMIYNFLVINLAIADLIMGIFLLILGAQSVMVSGSYCRKDKQWRSGNVCTMLGMLATISSETSIAMLAILSSYRLSCVVRPIKSRDFKVRTAAAIAGTAWLIAIVIAVIPIIPEFSNYFTTDVWLSPNPYFKSDVVGKSKVKVFLDILKSYVGGPFDENSEYFEWSQLNRGLAELDSNYKVLGYFGYYSTHAVCLSKIFVTNGEPAWEYSLLVTIVNFMIFIYIVVAYMLMWRPGLITKNTATANRTGQSVRNMQKRIAVLVASDFACWVPTCMIAFLRLAGADVSDVVYALAAIVLLPINSALNPILYSSALHGIFDSVSRLAITCKRGIIRRFAKRTTKHVVVERDGRNFLDKDSHETRGTHIQAIEEAETDGSIENSAL